MRIAHLTDIHVQTQPRLTDLLSKRLLSAANLYLLGRRHSFRQDSVVAAVRAVEAQRPDVVVISGDLTAQALDAEFELARELLEPLKRQFPLVVIPGNHDTYVPEGRPGRRMRRFFGDVMGDGSPYLHEHGDVAFLALETCRAHLTSSGRVAEGHVQAAQDLLNQADERFTFLLIHYPVCNPDGTAHGPKSRAVSNIQELHRLLQATDRIGGVLHGHEHHGYRVDVASGAGDIPSLNPGSSGWAYLPDLDQTAHFNVYEADKSGLHDVSRFRLEGEEFVAEPGGAYATGR